MRAMSKRFMREKKRRIRHNNMPIDMRACTDADPAHFWPVYLSLPLPPFFPSIREISGEDWFSHNAWAASFLRSSSHESVQVTVKCCIISLNQAVVPLLTKQKYFEELRTGWKTSCSREICDLYGLCALCLHL